MSNFWMISDRNIVSDAGGGVQTGFGGERGSLTFWTSDAMAPEALTVITNWRQTSADDFKKQLIQAAQQFPKFSPRDNENQKHVTFFGSVALSNFCQKMALILLNNFCWKLLNATDPPFLLKWAGTLHLNTRLEAGRR